PWPQYAETFKLASNVVYLDESASTDFAARRSALYRQIRNGRVAMVFDYIHPFAGNDWHIECGKSKKGSGERVLFTEGACHSRLSIPTNFPFPVTVKLFRNGRELPGADPKDLKISEPGTYRLEVWT